MPMPGRNVIASPTRREGILSFTVLVGRGNPLARYLHLLISGLRRGEGRAPLPTLNSPLKLRGARGVMT